MLKMMQSASRVVLIIICITVCGALFLHIVDAKDFIILATMVFAFYFNKPQGNAGDENIPK